MVIENEVNLKPFILPLYANGVPTLLYNSVKGKFGNNKSNYLTLFGQTISPDSLLLNENFTLIAYFLKPLSLITLFGIPAFELTDKPIDLTLLYPSKTTIIQERLLNCENVEDMISILDNFLFKLMKSTNKVSEILKYASEKLTTHYFKESLFDVQKELNITERTFQRLFEKNIGISPNTYRRICQFNSAFIDLNLSSYSNLSDIAFKHGYSDQSHYIRAFKEFTNINPTQYLHYGTI